MSVFTVPRTPAPRRSPRSPRTRRTRPRRSPPRRSLDRGGSWRETVVPWERRRRTPYSVPRDGLTAAGRRVGDGRRERSNAWNRSFRSENQRSILVGLLVTVKMRQATRIVYPRYCGGNRIAAHSRACDGGPAAPRAMGGVDARGPVSRIL